MFPALPRAQMVFLVQNAGASHTPSLALAGACLALVLAWPKDWAKVLPPQVRVYASV